MSNQPPKQSTVAHASSGAKANPAKARPEAHDEDALHVPKGVSRGTFLFLIALMIFLLIIWLVPNAMFGIAGGPKNQVLVRFKLPSGGEVAWKNSDLLLTHRALNDAVTVDPLLLWSIGVFERPEPTDFTRIMVLDRIAQDAGIEVTDADLAGHLDGLLSFNRMTRDDFRDAIRARGLDQVGVERSIRMGLRAGRLLQLLGYIGAVPDPDKIEEQWKLENVEFAFDFVTLRVADLMDEARKELPADTELEAWFAKLPEGERSEFKSEEKRTGEVAFFRDAETTAAAELVAAYPEVVPEGAEATTPDELAHQYYNRVQWRRFPKPSEDGSESALPTGYFTFEEVKESCLAEAPVFFAMQRWIEDLNARHTNGEALDFAAETQKYGLDLQTYLEPLTRDSLASDAGARNREIANAIFSAPPDGSFFASPVSLPEGIAVVRSNSRTEPELPPFAEIREKVAERWARPKAVELAKERLADLRQSFESFEPPQKGDEPPPQSKKKKVQHYRAGSEAFAAAAQAQGLDVKHRDYLNKAGPPSKDPLADDEERRTLFSQAQSFGLYTLESDEVAAPGTSFDEEIVFLVRLAGKRDVPIDDMSPAQYEIYKNRAHGQAVSGMAQAVDLEYLKKNFGLWLYQDSPEAQAERKSSSKDASQG